MESNRRKKKLIGSPVQRKLLFLIIASAVIPTAIIAASLYYLIFNVMAAQIGIPEAIAYNLIPVIDQVNKIIWISIPIVLFLVWLIALELSHRITGPIYRLEKELDERISGKSHSPIRFRAKDEFKALADKINKLLTK